MAGLQHESPDGAVPLSARYDRIFSPDGALEACLPRRRTTPSHPRRSSGQPRLVTYQVRLPGPSSPKPTGSHTMQAGRDTRLGGDCYLTEYRGVGLGD
jgi:hypothetical protein